jgi:DNA-directed DNA polymerase III PolC
MLLNCHTYYSFKYGTLSIEELLDEVTRLGFDSIALTDVNNTSACIDFVRRSQEYKLHPVVGIDFRNGVEQQFVGIAKNNEGFRELNEFFTPYRQKDIPLPSTAPVFDNVYVIYPFSTNLIELKKNEFLGISTETLKKLPFSVWKDKVNKLVILQTSTFRHKRDFNIHRLMRAINRNTLLSKLPKTDQASPNDLFIEKEELLATFANYPEIIENTQNLLSDCKTDFEFGKNKNKRFFTSSEEEDFILLQQECMKGLPYRYKLTDVKVIERLNKELKVIRELGFCAYFLINWDIVNYAQSKNYYYVGRGSGANSVVAYLLRITNVDPIDLDLYFERFINPYRTSPPDFDVDFSWTDRDDVTRYIFDRYGIERTALLGTYITYNHKSAFREIGKVFGLPDEEITRLQRDPHPARADEYGKWVIKYSQYISGFPSHCSIHSSGIVISETPISYFSSAELLPKGFPSTQFDMQVAEDVGLHKFDILSQRGLGKIKDSLEIIKENQGVDIDIHDVRLFMNDPAVKQSLKSGEAIGCFYVESPAMRMLLTKLKAEDYKRLVAASSIIRPGVAKSGMMREYIERFQNVSKREKARKAIPEMYKILEETYGVMVYQEDVIKVAHYFAGLTLDEADILRRGMSWKFRQRNEFWKIRDKFFSNCKEKGYPRQTIDDIWRQIESFANYAFAKGHSASYAVESFQALYLKVYYPLEYMVATVNNGGGFYSVQLYLHEAKMKGARIEPPCVNRSNWLSRIDGISVFLGFCLLHELERETGKKLLAERNLNGSFTNLKDFTQRISISLEQLIILIRIGAFRFTGKGKKELLWDAHFLLGPAKKTKPEKTLFNPEVKEFSLPELWKHELEDAFDQLELLGFPIVSPFLLLKEPPRQNVLAKELPSRINQQVSLTAFLVHRKGTKTSKGEGMYFGTWLDEKGHWIDTVHFPPVSRQYPFRGPGCYAITGKVVEEYGFISIETETLKRLETRSIEE